MLRNILFAIGGIGLGFLIGFFVANLIGQRAYTNLAQMSPRSAPSERNRTDSPRTLTEEDIRGAIAAADKSQADSALQRKLGISLYSYATQTRDGRYLSDVVRLLRRAHDAEPTDIELTLMLANACFDSGRVGDLKGISDARKYYLEALVLKPKDAEARTDLGLTYYLDNPSDPAHAILEFRKALAIDVKNEGAIQNLAVALIVTGRLDEAEKRILELEKINSSNQSLADLRAQLAQKRNSR